MPNNISIQQLDSVEKIANYSKFRRLLHQPFKYISAILFRELIYPRNQKEKIVVCNLFYGRKMVVALPASTDIYLTGGKSHTSEIRLARFLILNLRAGDHFLDIGAHYGYFSLLGSEIVGASGQVFSFEPASKSHLLLQKNTANLANTTLFKKAISNSEEPLTFYEFPNLHSEYNASDVSQFEQEPWFEKSQPQKVTVDATTIDVITQSEHFYPEVIKIDVEGAEYDVIQGGMSFFQKYAPKIVMEYLEPNRKNETHQKALVLLKSLGYNTHIIGKDGKLIQLDDIDSYLISEKLESDNIVFVKDKNKIQ